MNGVEPTQPIETYTKATKNHAYLEELGSDSLLSHLSEAKQT